MASPSRTVAARVAVLSVVVLAACAAQPTQPDRAPEAVGTVRGIETIADATEVAFAPDAGFEYFDGTSFVLDQEVAVSGAVTTAADIEAGDRLQVWTAECAESYPVQCAVEFVEVLD